MQKAMAFSKWIIIVKTVKPVLHTKNVFSMFSGILTGLFLFNSWNLNKLWMQTFTMTSGLSKLIFNWKMPADCWHKKHSATRWLHHGKQTKKKINELEWKVLLHSLYLLDTESFDFNSFWLLQHFFRGQKIFDYLGNNQNAISRNLAQKPIDFNQLGIEKHIRWQKFIDNKGDYTTY